MMVTLYVEVEGGIAGSFGFRFLPCVLDKRGFDKREP